uniref:Genetic suppressor element-like domain-containing protein n=1 Tax=Oncorhynchus mykiss TaxID=8022 RepID=A0A8K9XAC8_ONCMY
MISTPTRTTATVSPLTPLANGSAAAQSAHSGFAAALRQLAKQAEDPRGSSPSSESSVSSPATCLSNSVTTPKRGLPGPLQTSSGVDSLPSTPPGVTIAPTHSKTSNILCIGEGHQVRRNGVCGVSRESVGSELSPTQKKGGYPVPSHHVLAHSSYPFSLTPSSVMQDRRLQGLSLPGQVHPAVPSGTVPEEYLRGLRPFATSEDLRLRSLHLGLDPVTAAHVTAAAAYYHPAYLHHLHRSVYRPPCLSPPHTQNQCSTDETERQRQTGRQRFEAAFVFVRPGSNASQRDPGNRESQPHLGAPPPLISPKAHPHLLPHPPVPPTTLWNPASLTETSPDPRRRFDSPIPPSRLPPGLTRAEWPPSWERGEEGCRRMGEGPERFSFIRGPVLQISGLWSMAELERSTHSLHHQHNHHHNHLHQKGSLLLSSPSPSSDLGPQNPVVYDKILQQQHRLVSKLDLEESRRREAREGGYYYDLDESYDESDEEEVKAHLRRVAEQPPLKLDTSSEKVCFLRVCGLTTLAHRDQLFHQKRRKRRRMLRERSISPPPVQGKRKTPCSTVAPVPPLSTTLTPEEMDCFPQLEDKKHFLNMLSLSHVTSQQRRDKEKMEGLLKAIKLKRVTLDTIRYNPLPLCSSTPVLSTDYPDSPSPLPPYPHHPDNLHTDPLNPQPPPPRHPPPLGLHPDRAGLCERHPSKRLQGLQNGASHLGHPTQLKVPLAGQNGQNKPWERFIREDFAQHFHQAVLQSTHKTLGSSICVPESSIKSEPSAPYNIPPLKRPDPLHTPPHPTNGHHPYPSPPHHDPDGVRVERSEEDEEEDEEETPRKWKGIESVFEAYQEYVDERGMERQVLHSQCRRLETQNYTLSLTAEQLSHSMAELLSQRQRVRDERERLQAQLEHFRKCLTLPNVHWGKGQLKGHLPR